MDNQEMTWTFFQHWNNSISRPERVLTPREHMWASELGGSFVDRYLKMRAEPYTNPPNIRSLRKFQAGREWERIVRMILTFSGIHKQSEAHVAFQYPDLLKVTGKADFIAGGIPDWSTARQRIKDFALLPDEIQNDDDDFYLRIIKNFEEAIGGKELKTIVLELKSCSSFMFDMYEATGKPNKHHALQIFHYLKSMDMREGRIIYISKDDCRMIEFGIFNPSNIEDLYHDDIQAMTIHHKRNVMPEKELEVSFDMDRGKFSKNWKVEYSNYLTKLYGYADPEEYREKWDREVVSYNRVLKRVVNGDKMTALNLEVIGKMQAGFSNYEQLVAVAKSKGIAKEEDEA